jgi:hypothetical protein
MFEISVDDKSSFPLLRMNIMCTWLWPSDVVRVASCLLLSLTVDGTVLIRRFRLFLSYSGHSPPFTETRDLLCINYCLLGRDSSVGMATGYGLHDQGGGSSSPGMVKFFTSPYRPDRLWGPPKLL